MDPRLVADLLLEPLTKHFGTISLSQNGRTALFAILCNRTEVEVARYREQLMCLSAAPTFKDFMKVCRAPVAGGQLDAAIRSEHMTQAFAIADRVRPADVHAQFAHCANVLGQVALYKGDPRLQAWLEWFDRQRWVFVAKQLRNGGHCTVPDCTPDVFDRYWKGTVAMGMQTYETAEDRLQRSPPYDLNISEVRETSLATIRRRAS